MTLLRNINFSDIFSDIRHKMNIDNKLIIDKDFGKFSFNMDWENIEISGITITPSDKNFRVENNELYFKNTKVLLYIRDQAVYSQPEETLKNYKSNYKFHLSWCQTLQTMFNSGKYEKYVVSTRQDDVLLVRAIGSNNKVYESEQKLHVCKYCLSTLNYKGYKYATKAQKEKIYNEFSLKEFFSVQNSDYSFHDMPKHDEYNAETNIYPENWEHVSELHRKLCHYKCERCGKDCSHDHKLLHVHHKNGNKQDIRQSNLIALCIDCHLKEHPHMRNLY